LRLITTSYTTATGNVFLSFCSVLTVIENMYRLSFLEMSIVFKRSDVNSS